jgi:hypothetical protein
MASEIRVNQIQNRSGLGTVTFSDSGVILSGVTTITGNLEVSEGITASITGDINAGIITATSITGVSTAGITTAYIGSVNDGPLSGARNRIINGDMRIDQRNAGASVTPAASEYTLDRWLASLTQASKYSVQQSATAPAGFNNSLLVTSLSAYSVTAGDVFLLRHYIEGFNFSDLGWGSASAQTITLSFWVRSSLTGTFGGSLQNSSETRSYPFAYTISAADTWEQKTLTIAGETSGTWIGATNGVGVRINFGLGSGASRSGTAGSWAATDYRSATGATSVVATSGATFYITGVQLEPGTVATPFERRSYGQELSLCQRYFVIYRGAAGANDYAAIGVGVVTLTTRSIIYIPTPVTLRASPTFAYGGTVTVSDGVIGANVTSVGTQYMSASGGAWLTVNHGSGLTQGRGAFFYTQNATTNFFTLSSEI